MQLNTSFQCNRSKHISTIHLRICPLLACACQLTPRTTTQQEALTQSQLVAAKASSFGRCFTFLSPSRFVMDICFTSSRMHNALDDLQDQMHEGHIIFILLFIPERSKKGAYWKTLEANTLTQRRRSFSCHARSDSGSYWYHVQRQKKEGAHLAMERGVTRGHLEKATRNARQVFQKDAHREDRF